MKPRRAGDPPVLVADNRLAREVLGWEPRYRDIDGIVQMANLALPLAKRLYLTRVHAEVEGDAFFPTIDETQWRLVKDEPHAADEHHEFSFSFRVLER